MVRMGRGLRLGLFTLLVAAASCGGSSRPNGLVGSVSRGSANLRLEDTAGSNVAPSHIPANEITVGFRDLTMGITVIDVIGLMPEGGDSYTNRWDLVISLDGPRLSQPRPRHASALRFLPPAATSG